MLALLTLVGFPGSGRASFVTFESGHVRPLALSPDGSRLYAVNTPDNHLEIFAVAASGLSHLASVPVGLEPVAVAARGPSEVWVVNHLSDSISIVDVAASPPRVVRTLLLGDEPRDIVFAGPGGNRAFVTAAHRGQNRPGDPQLDTEGIGRADVWVFDATNLGAALGGTPLSILTLFSDTPRALVAAPDGSTVLAAGFHTGNRTTTINEGMVCNGGTTTGACTVNGVLVPGGLPGPDTNFLGTPRPEVGLIVRFNGTSWLDPVGRSWNDVVRFTLPDKDVFVIDAMATPPVETAAASSVGTILFNMVVNPVTGKLYVTNTEARNEVRFEGPGVFGGSSVRGHLHEARVTVLGPSTGIQHRHLNKHIDYGVVPSPAGVAERSLATPTAMAVTSDGATLWVAAFGSSKVARFAAVEIENDTFAPDAADHVVVSGGGPSGLVLDEANGRLYVATRFDDSLSVIDTTAMNEIAHLSLHNPEPASVTAGRRLLYDARHTSSNGEASCAACHVFGDFDSLAWDLGNPDEVVLDNQNPLRPGLPGNPDFHPMKGPMTTQSLRGMAGQGPMHWRGDRNGGLDAPSVQPDSGAFDENAAFLQFNPAFVGLLGRATTLPDAEMQAFADFILQVTYPPNPIRALDNSLTANQTAGRNFYFSASPSDTVGTCNFCHVLDPAAGFFGGDGVSIMEPQAFKIAHLRNAYQKVGMFGMARAGGFLAVNQGNNGPLGDQVRGFGFLHDGSFDTLFRFFQISGFNQSANNAGGFTANAAGDLQRRQMEQFVLAFDSDLAPIVGQQVSATATTFGDGTVIARVSLMIARDEAGECDLVVKGVLGGAARGWLYDRATNLFHGDRLAEPGLSEAALRGQAQSAGQARSYTCVPPGSGIRIGLDRDEDGFLDRDERDAGSDPADASSTPGSVDVTMIRGSALALRDRSTPPADPGKRQVRFQSAKSSGVPSGVVAAAPGSTGDPTPAGSVGGAVLVVANADGSGEIVTLALPAGRWTALGSASQPRGYRYTDPQGVDGPIRNVTVTSSGTLTIAGKGATWPYTLDEPTQGAVAVRLRLGGGTTWCTSFPAQPSTSGAHDRVDRFDGAANLPIPASCPPLP